MGPYIAYYIGWGLRVIGIVIGIVFAVGVLAWIGGCFWTFGTYTALKFQANQITNKFITKE